MQSVKELRNLAKSQGVSVTFIDSQGKRRYYTKKQLMKRLMDNAGMKGGSWSDFVHGLAMPWNYIGAPVIHAMTGADVKIPDGGSLKKQKGGMLLNFNLRKLEDKAASGLRNVRSQMNQKMTAGDLDEKRQIIRNILDKLTVIAENRMMQPQLQKFYS